MMIDLVPLALLLGLMVGSFLNVCIARIPAGASVVAPGSKCPSCGTPIAWFDNIPVVSYLALRGQCRSCRVRISPRYLAVEVVTALAFAAQAWVEPSIGLPLLSRLVFTALLVALAGTDLETFRLPNPLTLGGTVVALIFAVGAPPGVIDAALGASLGAGILLAIRWSWQRATGTDAMGLGDVKMLAMIGAFLGWQQVFLVLLLSTFAGATVGILVAATGRGTMRTKLPFGVFLSLAALAASLIGRPLLAWYVSLLNP